MATRSRLLRVLDFGTQLVPFKQALQLQELLHSARHAGSVPDTLVLLQHSHVFTIGKRGKEADFRVPLKEVTAAGAEICHVPRGGEVTYHGPGQLVAYPIFDIRALGLGARAFVESLEDSVVSTLGAYGIVGRGRVPGATGVWVEDRKIAAIGVKISHGVSSHGLALNVSTDLSMFDFIVPCGIADKAVTSISKELQQSATADASPASSSGSSACVALAGATTEEGHALFHAAKHELVAAFQRSLPFTAVEVQRPVQLDDVVQGLPSGAAD